MTHTLPSPAATIELTHRFGSLTALDGVTMRVETGEIVALIGGNGAGKTTLIRLLLGLLVPSGGATTLFGEPPTPRARARVGYVPQGLGLYRDLTIAENLAFRRSVFDGRAGASVAVDVGAPVNRLVGELPLGVQRRVAFAAALAHRPELLILDEPTSGVSSLARSELWDLVRQHARGGGAALVSTHHMDEAARADRLIALADGRVVAHGTVEELIGDRRTLVVTPAVPERWSDVFQVLERAEVPVVLAGRTVRVPLLERDLEPRVVGALDAVGIDRTTELVPASLDETMVELAATAERSR